MVSKPTHMRVLHAIGMHGETRHQHMEGQYGRANTSWLSQSASGSVHAVAGDCRPGTYYGSDRKCKGACAASILSRRKSASVSCWLISIASPFRRASQLRCMIMVVHLTLPAMASVAVMCVSHWQCYTSRRDANTSQHGCIYSSRLRSLPWPFTYQVEQSHVFTQLVLARAIQLTLISCAMQPAQRARTHR